MVIQQNSRKLLMMDILMSETCWAHKKWNKLANDIKLVFYSSTVELIANFLLFYILFSICDAKRIEFNLWQLKGRIKLFKQKIKEYLIKIFVKHLQEATQFGSHVALVLVH